MAIYRCEVKAVQRSKGRSSTAAAAYRAGEQITDERTGEVHDYTRKQGVAETGLTMPEGESWKPTRAELWNEAEASEKRKDGTPAREHIIALPHELDDAQRSELVKGYAQDLSNRHGCAVDYAIHEPAEKGDDRNHHAHILRTTRKVDGEGLGEKCAVEKAGRNRREDLLQERKIWEQHCNRALEKAGHQERVDHRSHQERGDGLEPEPKQGPTATAMERRGEQSEAGAARRQTKRDNWRRREIGEEIREADGRADRARTEHQHAKEANDHERTRRTARAHGIEPVNDRTGSAPGERRDIERRTGPRVEAIGPDTGTQRGRRGDAAGAGDAVPNVQRGGDSGNGQRARADLLPATDARHGRGEGHKMQSTPDGGSGAGLGQALGQGAKQAGSKLKQAGQAKKTKQGQQAEEVQSQFKKFGQQLGQFAGQIIGALKERSQQPQQPGKPASQKAQPTPQRAAPTPRPQQAATEPPAPTTAAPKIEAKPEPKPEAKPKPSADYAAKVLEIDARLAAKNGKTDTNSSLHRFAYTGKRAETPDQMRAFETGLSQRSQALGQRAAAGDPAALGDLKAAAGRLTKADPLELANAERNHDKRSPAPGLELSADRLGKAAAGDMPGLDNSLASKPPAGSTVAEAAKKVAETIKSKTGPDNIMKMKGPKG